MTMLMPYLLLLERVHVHTDVGFYTVLIHYVISTNHVGGFIFINRL